MIGVVIRREEGLAEDGLPFAMRKRLEQIGRLVFDQVYHPLEIRAECFHALVPRSFIRRSRRSGPISTGKFRRGMFRIESEFQDVPLRDSQMLQQLPWRVFRAFGLLPRSSAGMSFTAESKSR